ncbi:uncharacterized protein LOC100576288 [Apis mellifera]|uniref:Uncharacterized protein LOC100576288 n=1 Tax=Apis mellifera TaxID=7460 RepID=A0A7M7GWC6_APIME|nr:uncharacterized protein LOC100576288 [Apis mellifera]|eukprot:XP_006568171.1 uncharacterized protein LOC100576288 [Apis mellifera]
MIVENIASLHAMGSTTLVARVPPRGTCYIDPCPNIQTRREIFSSSRNNSWGPNYQSSCCVESAQTGVSSRLLLRRLPTLPTHVRAICVCQLSFARSRHHQYIYRVFG